jgi:dihydrofolate reductase
MRPLDFAKQEQERIVTMRRIILYINSTFNGVVTGDPKKDKTNFMVWTTEASVETGSECLLKALDTVDTVLLGRRTYEDLNRKWPFIKDWGPISEVASQLGERINNAPNWLLLATVRLTSYSGVNLKLLSN